MNIPKEPPLRQTWPSPREPLPIVLVGAGAVVSGSHLPAYERAGYSVASIFDIERDRASRVAQEFGIPRVLESLEEAFSFRDCVFDIAVPPEELLGVLAEAPENSIVLMQKPMGENLSQARMIRKLCHAKRLTAAVNFQFRFSSLMLAIRDAIDRGWLGTITELEFRLNLRTPWEVFPFCKHRDRLEIQIHTVHYLDCTRALIGDPLGVHARTLPDPRFPDLTSTRSTIILDYGDAIRCCLSINHNFAHGPNHVGATIKVEGTDGAAVGSIGVHPDWPPETLELKAGGWRWENVPLRGRWFPDAFAGSMASLQSYAAGDTDQLPTSVDEAIKTMAIVEACYESNAAGCTPIPDTL